MRSAKVAMAALTMAGGAALAAGATEAAAAGEARGLLEVSVQVVDACTATLREGSLRRACAASGPESAARPAEAARKVPDAEPAAPRALLRVDPATGVTFVTVVY